MSYVDESVLALTTVELLVVMASSRLHSSTLRPASPWCRQQAQKPSILGWQDENSCWTGQYCSQPTGSIQAWFISVGHDHCPLPSQKLVQVLFPAGRCWSPDGVQTKAQAGGGVCGSLHQPRGSLRLHAHRHK